LETEFLDGKVRRFAFGSRLAFAFRAIAVTGAAI
jgi:hypothetical protein